VNPIGKHMSSSQVYKLFGGSVAVGIPGNPANIFAYSGPRGLQARLSLACTLFPTAAEGRLHPALLDRVSAQRSALCSHARQCRQAIVWGLGCLCTDAIAYAQTRVSAKARAQVRGVLDEAEAAAAGEGAWLRGAHVVVGMPAHLAAVAAGPAGSGLWAGVRAVAVDEADACLQVGEHCPNLNLTYAAGTRGQELCGDARMPHPVPSRRRTRRSWRR